MLAFKNTTPGAIMHLQVGLHVMSFVPACMCSIAQLYSIISKKKYKQAWAISALMSPFHFLLTALSIQKVKAFEIDA